MSLSPYPMLSVQSPRRNSISGVELWSHRSFSEELPEFGFRVFPVRGSTASVSVRDGYIGHVFLDTLSFLEKDGEWKIYNKLFHVES